MRSPAPAARRALAATILASVAVLAAACSSSSSSPGATATVTAPPSSSPSSAATSTSPATPTPPPTTTPAGSSACATSQLHVSAGNSNGAAGTIYYDIIFANTSGASCTLRGYPGISFVSAPNDSGSQIGADAKRNTIYPAATITLAPGASAHALLGIADAANYPASSCNPQNVHYMKVFPPNQTVATYFSFSTQTCASTSQPTMRVSTITTGA